MTAKDWIAHLQLTPHPEGGFYREHYRSSELIARESLPARFGGDRHCSTSIYFLLTSSDISAFHRIKQDEIWHFYDGAPLTLHVIDTDGSYHSHVLGKDIATGAQPQLVIPAGCTFGAEVLAPDAFTLTGATVAPGFDFDDFEMPSRAALLSEYPQHQDIIQKLTYEA